jgi:hypothetical protein
VTPFNFLLFALATWYVANLLVHQAGPYGVFVRVRRVVNPYGAWLTCTVCFSVWVALALYIAVFRDVDPLAILAIAGGSVAVDGWVSR